MKSRRAPWAVLNIEHMTLGRLFLSRNFMQNLDFFITDHLGSVRAVVNLAAGTVAERDDYMAYGTTVPNATDSTAFPRLATNLYGFSGKEELNTTLSVPYLDFGARIYDPFTASWLSPDPLAADYPGISPYAYCAGDPVNLVDPNGRKILIPGKKGMAKYSYGMDVTTIPSESGQLIAQYLNYIVDMGGEAVISTLTGSDNWYSIIQGKSKYRDTSHFYPTKNGGTITLGSLFNQDEASGIGTLAHELFHALQHHEGQGKASIFNEVEAYVFEYIIQSNWIKAELYVNCQSESDAGLGGEDYQDAFYRLVKQYDDKTMRTAVRYFKNKSNKNKDNLYESYDLDEDNKSVLQQYHPILR